jgi:hypothetical protein
LDLLLRHHRRLLDGVQCWDQCWPHHFILQAGEFGSKHYEGLGSHARSRCMADPSTAALLFSISNGTAAGP